MRCKANQSQKWPRCYISFVLTVILAYLKWRMSVIHSAACLILTWWSQCCIFFIVACWLACRTARAIITAQLSIRVFFSCLLLSSDQRHDGHESVAVTVSPFQPRWLNRQPARPHHVQPGQRGGHWAPEGECGVKMKNIQLKFVLNFKNSAPKVSFPWQAYVSWLDPQKSL